jgi:geranylgeranyl diphosphate synthase type II
VNAAVVETVESVSSLVPDVLDEYGALTRVALKRYLLSSEPRRYLYDPVADYPLRAGRMLRSTLALAATRAFGGSIEQVMNTAVALELLHNAFLVHDDVEDDGLERRGRPTLNVLHGAPVAVNVGDALSILSLRPLLDNRYFLGHRLSLRILEETERMVRESIEGQAVELGWRRDNAVGLREEDYLKMVLKKTCWYTTIFPLRAGALIATRDGIDLDRLTRFGFFVGAAFQIQDDLLNLVGNHRLYGKELDGDIWEGKRTLMMIRLFECLEPDDLRRLLDIMARHRAARTVDDVRWVRDRMQEHDCIGHAHRVAHALAGAATQEFEIAFGHLEESRDKRFLRESVRWVLSRA